MSYSALGLLFLLLAPTASAVMAVSFDQPLTAIGDEVSSRGEYAGVWFGEADRVSGTLVARGEVQAQPLYMDWYSAVVPPVALVHDSPTPRHGERDVFPPFVGNLAKDNAVAAIVIHAHSVELESGPAFWRGDRFEDTECIPRYQQVDQRRHMVMPEPLCPGSGGFRAEATAALRGSQFIPFEVRAQGIISIDALGFSQHCSDRCPDLGYYERNLTRLGPGGIDHRNYTFTRVWGGLDNLVMSGTMTGGNVVAESGLLRMNGTARLPKAGEGSCPEHMCQMEANQTLRVSGEVAFAGLRGLGEGSRMTTQVTGAIASIQVDNRQFLNSDTAGAAVVAGLAAAVAGILAKVASGLVASRSQARPLDHPNRRKIADFVRDHPGATFREVLRGTGVPAGTARHHLAVLAKERIVTQHGHRQTLRFFENHGRFDRSWNTVVLLREPDLKRLHDWLLGHPDTMQGDIVESASTWGWSRSTTQHRLGRMVAEGLIEVTVHGRRKHYTANRRAPVPV